MSLPKTALIFIAAILFSFSGHSQLKPGFSKKECIEMLQISAYFGDSAYRSAVASPSEYNFVSRSAIMGLENRWDLWVHKTKRTAVISVRGTTLSSVSWLANFYAAMVPAKGQLELGKNDFFNYTLSEHPQAAVHVGWLISTAFLSRDILPKIDSCYKNGIKDFVVTGHSQGGGISYLLTSYLYSLQKSGTLPQDIRFKTYASAAPKPGNLFFAYDYERQTQGGWAFNVVNSADWVPEVPMSIQTVEDFNALNPFVNAKGIIRKQSWPKRLVLKKVYNNLSKPMRKAQKNYQKYLGDVASKMVMQNIEGFKAPKYYNSNHYVRTGTIIVLYADAAYVELFPQDPEKAFMNHFPKPYIYLAEKLDFGND